MTKDAARRSYDKQKARHIRADCARLQAIPDAVDLPLRVEHDGRLYVLKDGRLDVFAARYEVVAAFLAGAVWGTAPIGWTRRPTVEDEGGERLRMEGE